MSKDDSTGKGKSNGEDTVTLLRSPNPTKHGKPTPDKDIEKKAVWLEHQMGHIRLKIKEVLPVGRKIREHFKTLRRDEKFRGCTGWEQYCDKKLHITAAGWRMMEMRLKVTPHEQKEHKVTTEPTPPPPPPPTVLTEHDRTRLTTAADLQGQWFAAKDKGDATTMAKVEEDLRYITNPRGLDSPAFPKDDLWHEVLTLRTELHKAEERIRALEVERAEIRNLFLGVLGEIRKADEEWQTLPADLMRVTAVAQIKLEALPKDFGIDEDEEAA